MQLHTVFQPIVNLDRDETIGHEALLRGHLPPDQLFEHAVSFGCVPELDKLARGLALDSYGGRRKLFINCHPLAIEDGFHFDFEQYSGAAPRDIVIELTEQTAIDAKKVQFEIKKVKEMGIGIAIDDFGHGFTNLSLIESLEPDYIKLDRTLIKNFHNEKVKKVLIGIAKLGQEVGTTIIAEGIETEEQKRTIRDCGIDFGQGWHLGKPFRFDYS